MNAVSYYLLIINAAGLLLMLADKKKAMCKQWRIPEAVLLGTGLLGGSLGCFLGMQLFRHKTRKPAFSLGIPAMLFLHIFLFFYLYSKF